MSRIGGDPWDHLSSTEGFDKQNERHDAKDIVVRREGRQPMYREVVDPDNQDWAVDRK